MFPRVQSPESLYCLCYVPLVHCSLLLFLLLLATNLDIGLVVVLVVGVFVAIDVDGVIYN